jgi:hypothetical protein
MVHPGSLPSQEAMQKAVGADGLEELQAAAAGEAPLRPAIGAGELAVVPDAAQAGEERRGVLDPALGQRDVVEADPGGSAQLSGG